MPSCPLTTELRRPPACARPRLRHVCRARSDAGSSRTEPRRAALCSLLSAPLLLAATAPAFAVSEFPQALSASEADAAPPPPLRAATLLDARPLFWPSFRETGAERLRNAAEWSLLLALAWRAYGDRARTAIAERLGWQEPPGRALEGTRLRLSLDIGRERGTWMPPDWARSGRRLLFDTALELRPGGEAAVLAVGAYAGARFGPGRWSVEGASLEMTLPLLEPLLRGDVSLPAGPLILKARAWGGVVGSRGTLLVMQTRWVVRRELRIVGTFRCAPLEEKGGDAGKGLLAAARVRQRFTE